MVSFCAIYADENAFQLGEDLRVRSTEGCIAILGVQEVKGGAAIAMERAQRGSLRRSNRSTTICSWALEDRYRAILRCKYDHA